MSIGNESNRWTGTQCDTDLCLNHCSEHGVCVGVDRCHCFAGWLGRDCSEDSCPNHCSGECLGDIFFLFPFLLFFCYSRFRCVNEAKQKQKKQVIYTP
jgi:hypothetical protein